MLYGSKLHFSFHERFKHILQCNNINVNPITFVVLHKERNNSQGVHMVAIYWQYYETQFEIKHLQSCFVDDASMPSVK